MRSIGVAGLVLAAGALFAGCGGCGDEEGEEPDAGGPLSLPEPSAAVASLTGTPFHEATLESVLARFDVDGSGFVDAADGLALEACLEAASDLEAYVERRWLDVPKLDF